MGRQRLPNFGKVALSVFESKVESVIGKDAITEIKLPLTQKELHEALIHAAQKSENRLIADFPEKDIIVALKQLPISSLNRLEEALWEFYENPLSAKLQNVIHEQISFIVPNKIDKDKLSELVCNYFRYFREEAVLIPEVNQKLIAISTLRIEHNTQRSADALEYILHALRN